MIHRVYSTEYMHKIKDYISHRPYLLQRFIYNGRRPLGIQNNRKELTKKFLIITN